MCESTNQSCIYLGNYLVITGSLQPKQIVEQLFGNFESVTEMNLILLSFEAKSFFMSVTALFLLKIMKCAWTMLEEINKQVIWNTCMMPGDGGWTAASQLVKTKSASSSHQMTLTGM
jgi:hypothetical protein